MTISNWENLVHALHLTTNAVLKVLLATKSQLGVILSQECSQRAKANIHFVLFAAWLNNLGTFCLEILQLQSVFYFIVSLKHVVSDIERAIKMFIF